MRSLYQDLAILLLHLTCTRVCSKIQSQPLDFDFLNVARPREENGVLILQDVEHVSDLLHDSKSTLLLAALYSSTCSHSTPFMQKLEEAAEDLAAYFMKQVHEHSAQSLAPPLIAKLDANRVDTEWTQTLGIGSYPALFFFRQVKEEIVVMEYMGLKNDPTDIVDTILHYWYRYEMGPIVPRSILHDVQAFLYQHGAGMLRRVPPAWNPDYSPQSKEAISWMMYSENDDPDHYVIFVQCRSSAVKEHLSSYKNFTNLSKIVSTQRDVALFSVSNCSGIGNDGDVLSFTVDPMTFKLGRQKTKPIDVRLDHYVVRQSTPSVLFYDRISTGPIAFANYRHVHAVLMVRLSKDDYQSHLAVRTFRKACQANRLADSEDLVCLVVPETETRILTYFGVDIWTPLDAKVVDGTPIPEALPVLLITDQRDNNFRRYYLDAATIAEDNLSMSKFMQQLWSNALTPETKSSSHSVRKNSHGVEIITAKAFHEVVMERSKHTLLFLHAPTCGHCKRLSAVWNTLSKMVDAVAWDTFLDVMKMDVTQNEVEGINPAFLPAIYYFAPGSKDTPIQFNVRDQFEDSAGRLKDPIEIIDWMLTVSDIDEGSLMDLLKAQNGEGKTKSAQKEKIKDELSQTTS